MLTRSAFSSASLCACALAFSSLGLSSLLPACSTANYAYSYAYDESFCVTCGVTTPMMVGTTERVSIGSETDEIFEMPAMRTQVDEAALLTVVDSGRNCCTRHPMKCEYSESNDCFYETCGTAKLEASCDTGQYSTAWITVASHAVGTSHVHFVSLSGGSVIDTLTLDAVNPKRLALTWYGDCPADAKVVSAPEHGSCSFEATAFDPSDKKLQASTGFVGMVEDTKLAHFAQNDGTTATSSDYQRSVGMTMLTGGQGSTFLTVSGGDASVKLEVVVR